MTLIDFDKKELLDIYQALLCYGTDMTIIDPKGNGLTDEQKAFYHRLSDLMEKITFNNEQLEFLKFIVQDFEYNDDHERYMIEQIENKIYQAQENQALKLLTGLN